MRNETLDDLKLVLAIMVAAIHTNFLSEYFPAVSHGLVDYLFRIAVPLFFIINGYFAAGVIDNSRRFARWGLHICLLFAFWNLVYSYEFLGRLNTVEGIVDTVFIGFYHLWYLPAVLAAGAVFHLLRRLSTPVILTIMAMGYATGLCLQYAGNYHLFSGTPYDHLLNHYPVYRNFLFLGVPFFGLGLLSARHNLAARLPAKAVTAGLIAGLACLASEFVINQGLGMREGMDLLFALPLLGFAVFLWALQSRRTTQSSEISDTASLIFFLHPLVLKGLEVANVPFGRSLHLVIVLLVIFLTAPVLTRFNTALRKGWKVSLI